jgi:hypothetical protein
MQDIERAEPRLMTTPGLESSRKTLVLRLLVLIGSTKVYRFVPLGGPSLPSDFSADGLSTRELMICPAEPHLYPAVVLEILHTT